MEFQKRTEMGLSGVSAPGWVAVGLKHPMTGGLKLELVCLHQSLSPRPAALARKTCFVWSYAEGPQFLIYSEATNVYSHPRTAAPREMSGVGTMDS